MLRKSHRRRKRFRLFFATDIHGSDRCFRKFLAAAEVYEAAALILGGDIAGKGIVPIVLSGSNTYRYRFQGVTRDAPRAQLDEVEERIRFNGLYPYVCTEEESDRIRADRSYRDSLFEKLIVDQINGWRALADDRLARGVRCIITPGNDDPCAVDPVLKQPGVIECPEREAIRLGPVLLASLGNTNHTPWHTEREYDEAELATQIDEMVAPNVGEAPFIFNFHCPPYGSTLDTVVKLDDNLSPIIERGSPVEVPAGSRAVREAIEKYAPVVGLHGHIHESQGVQRIGKTTCINPGSEYSSGTLKGAIVDVDEDGELISHLLTSG